MDILYFQGVRPFRLVGGNHHGHPLLPRGTTLWVGGGGTIMDILYFQGDPCWHSGEKLCQLNRWWAQPPATKYCLKMNQLPYYEMLCLAELADPPAWQNGAPAKFSTEKIKDFNREILHGENHRFQPQNSPRRKS